MSNRDIVYHEAAVELLRSIPELVQASEKLKMAYAEQPPEPYAYYMEVLMPFLKQLLHERNELEDKLVRIFDLVERLATSSDPRVKDIAVTAVVEDLVGESIAEVYMGRATRRILRNVDRV